MKPLGCDPQHVKGMSEKLIVSHYENNYGGAVKRLNLITEQLAGLDFNTAANFLINGLKREELIASNSMILHELFFAGLGDASQPGKDLAAAIARDFGSVDRWRSEFIVMGRRWAVGRAGCCCPIRRATAGSSINGRPTTATPLPEASPSWRSICTSTPIISTTAPRQPHTLTPT
jgi:hypothetical protein